MSKDESNVYIALLGWNLKAIEAIDRFDRRYVVPWAAVCAGR